MSIQWQEVDAAQFDTYPGPQGRPPDELDVVMDALQDGKTIELTVGDESAIRGRRMALGRRAKSRGFPIQMRYRDNKIIVRRVTVDSAETDAPLQSEPATEGDGSAAAQQPRRGRSRKGT